MKKSTKWFLFVIILLLLLVVLFGWFSWDLVQKQSQNQAQTSSTKSEDQSPEENKITVYCDGGKGEINVTIISQKKQDLIFNFFEENKKIKPSNITPSEDGTCFFVKISNVTPGQHTVVLKIGNLKWNLQVEVQPIEIKKIIIKITEPPTENIEPTPEPIIHEWPSNSPEPTSKMDQKEINIFQILKEFQDQKVKKSMTPEVLMQGHVTNNQTCDEIIFSNIPSDWFLLIYCPKNKTILILKENPATFRSGGEDIWFAIINKENFLDKNNWDAHVKKGEAPFKIVRVTEK
jgi:hypothetical protein